MVAGQRFAYAATSSRPSHNPQENPPIAKPHLNKHRFGTKIELLDGNSNSVFAPSQKMLNRLIHFLLIVTLVTCPIRCLSGMCECSCNEATVSQSDCEAGCCHSKPESPRPTPNDPCKKCHCLCSGATLPDHFELDRTIHFQGLGLLDHSLINQPSCLVLVQHVLRITRRESGRKILAA